jgi:hypothetical protein
VWQGRGGCTAHCTTDQRTRCGVAGQSAAACGALQHGRLLARTGVGVGGCGDGEAACALDEGQLLTALVHAPIVGHLQKSQG